MKLRRWIAILIALVLTAGMWPGTDAVPVGFADSATNQTAHTHTWGGWQVLYPATCERPGIRLRVCSQCGMQDTEDIPVDSNAHAWGAWKVARAAICSQEGSRTRVCDVCGKSETQTIAKTAHTWGDWTVTSEANCKTAGERSHSCTVCGEKQTEAIAKTAHSFGDWKITVQATDHSSGIRARTCKVCGAKEEKRFDPEGTLRRGDTGDGVRQLQRELVCYGALKKNGVDGSYGGGTEKAVKAVQQAEGLTVDGVAWPQTRAVLGHRWSDWEVVSELTDFSAGKKTRTCTRCGAVETEEEMPSPLYRRGDHGNGVKALQAALNAAGYECGTADGSFGAKTETAVKAFEKANGVPVDGIAWPGVLKLLGLLAGDVSIPDSAKLGSPAPIDAPVSPEGGIPIAEFLAGNGLLLIVSPTVYKEDAAWDGEDTMGFRAYLRYEGKEALSGGTICMYAGEELLEQKDVAFSEGMLSDDAEFTYLLPFDVWDSGELVLRFTGVGHPADTAKEDLEAKDVKLRYAFGKTDAPLIGLSVDPIPAKPYKAGDKIKVAGTLRNHLFDDSMQFDSLEFTGLQGGIFSTETWMDTTKAAIAPASENRFGIALTVSPEDVSRGWGYRRIRANVHIPETGETASADCLFFYALQKTGASVLLILPDTTGMTSRFGQIQRVPVTVYNNGGVDLKIDSFEGASCEGNLLPSGDSFAIPEAYKSLFPAGASFALDYFVAADADDRDYAALHSGAFNRLLTVNASAIEGGAKVSDSDEFTIWMEDGLDEEAAGGDDIDSKEKIPDLELVVVALTEQSSFSSGEEVPLLISLYNNTTADMREGFVQAYDGVGDPREAYNSLYVLASDHVEFADKYTFTEDDASLGTVTLRWKATAKDASDAVVASNPVELTFTVGLGGEYGWNQPEDDAAVLITKTAEGGVDGVFHVDDIVHYTITVTNQSDEDIPNATVSDNINGDAEGVVIGSIHLEPHVEHTFTFNVLVTAEDAARGYIENYARVSWGENEDYREASTSTVRVNVEDGDKSVRVIKGITTVPSPQGFTENDIISYTITVINLTDEPINEIEVYDPLKGSNEDSMVDLLVTLGPAESVVLTYDHTVTSQEASEGEVRNTAFAVWTDDDGKHTEYSNEVVVPTYKRGLKVQKTIVSSFDAAKGGYTEGEPIVFEIAVTNNTGDVVDTIQIADFLNGSTTGEIVGTLTGLAPGEKGTIFCTYVVQASDIPHLQVTNQAGASIVQEDSDTSEIYLSNIVIAPVVNVAPDEPIVVKSVTNLPARGFFLEDEEITFLVTVVNQTGEEIYDLTVTDPLCDAYANILGQAASLASGESLDYLLTYKVDAFEASYGEVHNIAFLEYNDAEGETHVVLSNPVIAPTGEIKPTETLIPPYTPEPDVTPAPNGTPEPDVTPAPNGTPNPVVTPAPEKTPAPQVTPKPEPKPSPAPESGAGKSCVRTLTGLGEGVSEYSLEYCQTHMAVADAVEALIAQADDEASWRQAIALWTAALDAEYEELVQTANPVEGEILTRERELFLAQLACRQAAVSSLHPDDPTLALRVVAEQLMNKTADLCYEAHNAPAVRADSRNNGIWQAAEPIPPAERCGRYVELTDDGSIYNEVLCESHRRTENAASALLAGGSAETWQIVKHMWLTELDAVTNARYRAADPTGKTLVAAERVAFGRWLEAREEMLGALYPDRPEIVGEALSQAIRARVLDLCVEP